MVTFNSLAVKECKILTFNLWRDVQFTAGDRNAEFRRSIP